MPYNHSINRQDAFGAGSPCNLDNCPIDWSIYGYRPSLVANILFAALFAAIGFIQIYLGFRWKPWGFMIGMILGCIFFFIGSIYVTLSKTIFCLGPDLSRFKPQLFYWVFIPFDTICLVLQAAGCAMSTGSGSNNLGVDISMAGLILQVIVLVAFIAAFGDYMIQLQDGYNGSLIKEEVPFIILEGSVIVVAAGCLCVGHPGLVFSKTRYMSVSRDAEKRLSLATNMHDEDSAYDSYNYGDNNDNSRQNDAF
ncbi:hypothetical protein F53441_8156 [Fusarium austroafricanum]|uniref:Uncharacterized protein n=1 Tax=Fusarium austroafricanum TaxID=2364996 RepID=A0A8H4KF15_9HYPO|nr:hypothetical protein F53441_8156 [Fusarium austroafricanum]